jgi:phosphoribosylamine--glycine ligase
VIAYHAGTKLEKDGLTARGGRVLGITAVADTLEQAVSKAYAAVPDYLFYEAHYRTDIGKTALAYLTASREGEE